MTLSPHHRRIAALLSLIGLLLVTWIWRVDAAATTQVDAGLKRALATFAAARALNAVISVAQGTEVAVQPAGVGVTLAPGQVLDPINDLIEQFSTLMLMASAAFGAQRVLIGIGAWWPVSLLLSVVAMGVVAQVWRGLPVPQLLMRVLAGLLLVRFAVPLVALGSEATFQIFMKSDYQAAQSTLEVSSERLGQISAPVVTPPVEEGMGDRLRRWWQQGTDIGARFEEIKDVASRAVEHIVRLIVVFLLQTLVLPLLLGWALWRLARVLAGLGLG
jgi:hypothetical protein